MSEKMVISLVRDSKNNVVGRMVAEQDFDVWDKPSEYHDSNVSIRVVDAGYRVDESFYERNTSGEINSAFDRIMETFYGLHTNYGHWSDNIEVFERYMKIYRPHTPFIVETIATGYSQGDSVTLVAFIEEGNSIPSKGEATYHTAAREHTLCQSDIDICGAIARGQFWTLTRENIELESVNLEEDTVNVLWSDEENVGGILCIEEFWPWKELRDYADSLTDVDESLEDVEHEL